MLLPQLDSVCRPSVKLQAEKQQFIPAMTDDRPTDGCLSLFPGCQRWNKGDNKATGENWWGERRIGVPIEWKNSLEEEEEKAALLQGGIARNFYPPIFPTNTVLSSRRKEGGERIKANPTLHFPHKKGERGAHKNLD